MTGGSPNSSSQDFGLRGTGSSGDTIFYDLDGDGTQDAGEPGMVGVTVRIDVDLDGAGGPDFTATTTSDQNGNYAFGNLPAGSHTIIVTPPGGSNPTSDLDGVGGPDSQHSFTLAAGGTNNGEDFGFLGTGSIGDTIYWDVDNDGSQDAGEAGLFNVAVRLDIDFDQDGFVDHALNTTTDNSGDYGFSQLVAGDYTVVVTQPAGVTQTDDPDGGNDNRGSLTLAAGEANTAQNFGYRGNGSIGDRVFWDVDNDGAQDAGDVGLFDVEVSLQIDIDGDASVDYSETTRTDINGDYAFGNLIAGDYTISVTPGTVPGGMGGNPTFDSDGAVTPHTADLTLAANASDNAQDFGYSGTASLGDRVWLDSDGDGVQDASNEPGLANVDILVTWFGNDGLFGTADDESFSTTTATTATTTSRTWRPATTGSTSTRRPRRRASR